MKIALCPGTYIPGMNTAQGLPPGRIACYVCGKQWEKSHIPIHTMGKNEVDKSMLRSWLDKRAGI